MTEDTHKTHFGFQQVPLSEKASLVGGVFDSVASCYDIMNDLMSFGIHRLWKKFAIDQCAVRPGQKVLDVAGGTGDISFALQKKVGAQGRVLLTDINASMLAQGRDRLIDQGVAGNLFYVQADAEKLPFTENYFDCVTISFGLRNVTQIPNALASMYRILKPGGRLVILEFSKPMLPLLSQIYDTYSFKVLPALGQFVANDSESYRYLAESIRMHPCQEKLKTMILESGFDDCRYWNLSCGIVAVHKGYKY